MADITSNKNRKILIISYWYPPLRAISSLRIGKFAKYLSDFGWEPIVITVKPINVRFTRIDRLPDERRWGRVYRTRDLSFLGISYTIASRLRFFKNTTNQGTKNVLGSVRSTVNFKKSLFNAVLWAYKQFICFPDEVILWLLEYPKIEHIVRKERPDVIFSSSLPNTCHIIASRLSKKLHIPWVADFRDLWTQNHVFRRAFPLRSIEVWLERRTLKPATALITVSAPLKAQLKELHHKPVYAITNGYDPDDFPKKVASSTPHGPLIIIYTGTIYYKKQDPGPLFAALQDLLTSGEVKPEDVRVDFYGQQLDIVWEIVKVYKEVRPMVHVKGEVTYQQALQLQSSADVLLLLEWTDPHAQGVYTGKVFEYLGANRPILSIGPPGGVIEKLLEKTRAGIHLQSAEEIRPWIQRWLEEKRQLGKPSFGERPRQAIQQFTRREQTKKLAEILNNVRKKSSA